MVAQGVDGLGVIVESGDLRQIAEEAAHQLIKSSFIHWQQMPLITDFDTKPDTTSCQSMGPRL